jgi:hypothetical protein
MATASPPAPRRPPAPVRSWNERTRPAASVPAPDRPRSSPPSNPPRAGLPSPTTPVHSIPNSAPLRPRPGPSNGTAPTKPAPARRTRPGRTRMPSRRRNPTDRRPLPADDRAYCRPESDTPSGAGRVRKRSGSSSIAGATNRRPADSRGTRNGVEPAPSTPPPPTRRRSPVGGPAATEAGAARSNRRSNSSSQRSRIRFESSRVGSGPARRGLGAIRARPLASGGGSRPSNAKSASDETPITFRATGARVHLERSARGRPARFGCGKEPRSEGKGRLGRQRRRGLLGCVASGERAKRPGRPRAGRDRDGFGTRQLGNAPPGV